MIIIVILNAIRLGASFAWASRSMPCNDSAHLGQSTGVKSGHCAREGKKTTTKKKHWHINIRDIKKISEQAKSKRKKG